MFLESCVAVDFVECQNDSANFKQVWFALAAMAVVAAGYGGDMDEELANELLDDMDFDRYGKVKCWKIEWMLPKLMKMVEGEMESLS